MVSVRTYVFVHLPEGPVPAGLLTMTDEPRNKFATFAYGRRYLERPDRLAVDPVALPLHDANSGHTFRTEEGFAVFNGIRDAAPMAGASISCTRPWATGCRTRSTLSSHQANTGLVVWPLVRPRSARSASHLGVMAMRGASTSHWRNWPKQPNARSTSMHSTRTCGGC
ncbi:hypothetical protein [Hankyongella ginsenosidimutans]|uniref:hypothetical protein n=1 Tax=Hankyongella ginsenosidimutans TaxID=1763828 RepID=UPI001FE9E92D|nr:hypothetical protein [Hankyongella ginsenosidimutans]